MNKGRIGNLLSYACILSSCACTLVSHLNAYTNGLLPYLKNTFFFLSFGKEGLQHCYLERRRSLCIFAWSLPDLSALLVSVHLIPVPPGADCGELENPGHGPLNRHVHRLIQHTFTCGAGLSLEILSLTISM